MGDSKLVVCRKSRKSLTENNFSPRFDYSFYRRAPRYNQRVLIGNWYEETQGLKNYECHRQTEYQRQFSVKPIPPLRRSLTCCEGKGVKPVPSFKNIGHEDQFSSTYDLSYKYNIPQVLEDYHKCGPEVPHMNDQGVPEEDLGKIWEIVDVV